MNWITKKKNSTNFKIEMNCVEKCDIKFEVQEV